MVALAERLEWLPAKLAELLAHYDIPGGAVTVWHDGEQHTVASGQANTAAGIAATPDTLFLIGSITKVFTTSLMLRLVERGAVSLDAPVRTYLPELRLADDDATETVTVRHLLTHTNGITGDFFPDCGRGDDAVERCVALLAYVEMLHRPGSMYSYSNSGFILAGRLIERVTGTSWDRALRTELLEPLGSTDFATLPEEALRHRTAVAHAQEGLGGALRPGEMWPEVRSGAPAGFTPYATTAELVRFARLHLDGGVDQQGRRVLAEHTVTAMQAAEVASVPSGEFDRAGVGLGWARYRYGDEPVVGHNGGKSAVLRVLPRRNFAVASLTNAAGGRYVGHHVIDAIVDSLFGLRVPSEPTEPVATGVDLSRYEGVYRHHMFRHRVDAGDGALTVTTGDDRPVTLQPLDESRFVARIPGVDVAEQVAFLAPDEGGRPGYVHIGGRACVRT